MKDNNIYHDSIRQFNPKNMTARQQERYLIEQTKNESYDPEKDVSFIGKSRGSANDIDYAELFEQDKKRAVTFCVNYISRKREELFKNHPERLLMLAESLRCFCPIRRNKDIDRRQRKDYKKGELPQPCVCSVPTRV